MGGEDVASGGSNVLEGSPQDVLGERGQLKVVRGQRVCVWIEDLPANDEVFAVERMYVRNSVHRRLVRQAQVATGVDSPGEHEVG
jgi:hypothetical protein